MKRVRDLVNESGAGLWGTDKARERLQKDTPGQEIKSLVKKSQKVSEAMSDSEKRQALQKKIADVRRQYRAGTWDGNVNKDGKPVIHVDGKPMVVEGYDRAAISAALKKAAEKDNMKSKRDVERFFDYSGGDIIFKMVKDEDEANSLISQFKSQYKQKFKEDVDDNRDKLKMVNKNGNVVYATRDKVKHYMDLGYKSAAAADSRKKTLSRTNLNPDSAFSDVRRIAKDIQNKKAGDTPPRYRESVKEEVQQLDELKVSFKFDKLADAAKAERKAMQMKKLDVDSEKIQGKNMWLLHVTGSYTDIMKYLKRHDLEDKVHESAEVIKEASYNSIEEGSETWEAGYKRRVVRTTKPEHKEKGYNWRIKGKDKAHLTIKLYKDKPSQEEFNKQMKRVAGHEFGG